MERVRGEADRMAADLAAQRAAREVERSDVNARLEAAQMAYDDAASELAGSFVSRVLVGQGKWENPGGGFWRACFV